jgi:hypothetical protein
MRLLFYNYTTVEHLNLFPIAEEARKRGHEVCFIVHEPNSPKEKIQKNLRKYSFPSIWITSQEELETITKSWNFMVYAEPLRMYTLPKNIRGVQVYHGPADKGGHYIKELEKKWFKSFVCGEYEYEKLKEIVPEKINNCHIVGYPKFDLKEETKIEKKYIKTLLYIPTWNENLSSLPIIGKELIGSTYWRIIIKLHEHTINRKPEWAKFYREESKKREPADWLIEYTEEQNILPLFDLAHVVLSDCSSAMLEAVAMGKPVIGFNNPNSNFKDGQIEYEWRKRGIIRQASTLNEVVNLMYYGNFNLSKEQQNEVKRLFKYKKGASERIVNILEDSL